MAATEAFKRGSVDKGDEKSRVETIETVQLPSKPPVLEVARIRTDDEDDEDDDSTYRHSTFHIYGEKECYKVISPALDPTKERRTGPTLKQLKARRAEQKERKASGLPPTAPNDNAFFLHRPYLAFHIPPHVLYTGNSKHGTTPAVLIHPGCFWKEYKLQLGPSIGLPGVLDPRGVVAWKHNGGEKKALKADAHKLKGYKVRTWRLWGETGKEYVQCVKRSRATGEAMDPDVLDTKAPTQPAVADEVVHLRWSSPLSLQTRRYHFTYRGVDFHWKGTGTVKESRRCGVLLRFNHLKLVARLPLDTGDEKEMKKDQRREVCLGKFTSSVAKMKSGTLELYDMALVRLCEEYMSEMLEEDPFEDEEAESVDGPTESVTESFKTARLKKSTLYQVIVATALCMVGSEKEKRHTVLDFIMQAGEGGGGGGG
ncbi:hypothetical protein CC86DRAFT_165152 [Ophiobolus disseminans]|uniref:Uncharacterized protein n=1 Tax=Ophiobolus disseminans TaxID=1469910 RepID=A0A6A7ABF3_9PLEO|nr:hypothetical protein CC86DRAFT_165152 [Ophiobolus disseminans]